MKIYFSILLFFSALPTMAQSKAYFLPYNKLTELKGSDYVIATVQNNNKLSAENNYLLFINSKTGESNQIDFPKGASIDNIEHIRIDSLGINSVLVIAKAVDLDGDKSIDWNDPKQINVISIDGKEKTQITEDHFFISTWMLNYHTGTIVITGYYDMNKNGKYDKGDHHDILLYNLQTSAFIKRV